MNILFICQNNQLRSKIAEDFFGQLNTSSRHSARSAGTVSGNLLNRDLVRWADKMILVADNINPENIEGRFGKKVERWNISNTSPEVYREIEEKVKALVKELN